MGGSNAACAPSVKHHGAEKRRRGDCEDKKEEKTGTRNYSQS